MAAGTIDDVRRARRVLCFGVTGAGKTTLARALADRLALPLLSMDDLGWDAGWTQPDDATFDRRVLPLLQGETWAVDSVYRRHNAIAIQRADVIVGLDYSRMVSFTRLVRRTARRIRTREPACNGNVETLGRALGTDSILRWHARSFASKRERMRAWHQDPAAPPVLLLTSPRDATALLHALDVDEGAPDP